MGQTQLTGAIGFVSPNDLDALLGGGSAAGLDDSALLGRIAWGSRSLADSAFAALVARYGALVARVCGGVLGDHHAAEDAAQAVFLVLHARAGAIRDPDRLAPWLHGVALRTARAARRRARRELPATPTDRTTTPDEASPMTDPADALIALERAEALHAAIRSLPLLYRTPLILCDLQGLTHAEAAAHLGCPLPTLSSRLKRAKDQLRARLARRRLDLDQLPPLAGPAPVALVGSLVGFVRSGAARPSARALADRVGWLPLGPPLRAFGAATLLAGLASFGIRGDDSTAPPVSAAPLAQDPAPAAAPNPPAPPNPVAPPSPPAVAPQDPPPADAIRVGFPTRRAVPSFREFHGRVAATRTVELTSKINGTISEQPAIAEGDLVTAGQLLMNVVEGPDTPLALNLRAGRANLDARLVELKRREEDLKQYSDPPQSALTKIKIERARLDDDFARLNADHEREAKSLRQITAPFAGVITRISVNAGATAEAGKTPLATLAAVDPIRVDFQVSEQNYNEIRRWLRTQPDPIHLPVRVGLVDEEGYPHPGRVKFQAGQFQGQPGGSISTTLHAEVPNPDRTLVPGQTARVVVEYGDLHPAILVPASALLDTAEGPSTAWIWTRDEQGRATQVRGWLGLRTTDGLVEIKTGIEPTTPIVLSGFNPLTEGVPLPQATEGRGELHKKETPR